MGCEKDAFVMMQMAIAIIMWLSLLLLIHRLSFLFYCEIHLRNSSSASAYFVIFLKC